MLSFILATALAGCVEPPKPVKHHKHKAKTHVALPAPLCTAIEPRVIFLPAPEPLDPMPVTVVRYEIIQVATPVQDDPPPTEWWPEPLQFWAIGGGAWFEHCCPCIQTTPTRHSRVPPPSYQPPHDSVHAPEIDASSGIAAVTILALGLLIITDRRPRV